jgi:hypothetical protein
MAIYAEVGFCHTAKTDFPKLPRDSRSTIRETGMQI